MKTPFYIIKRTPANKETAELMAASLAGNCDPWQKNLQDLIDFCLSGGTEEKVYIEPGMRVRIKSMPKGAFNYDRPGVGAECEITALVIRRTSASFSLHMPEDFNCLRVNVDNVDNPDLSEYLELV